MTSVLLAAVLLSLCACGRFTGETQPITKEIPEQTAETPEEGIPSLPTAPVTVYGEAVMDFLLPMDEYSWEREYPPEYVMLHFTSAVMEHRDDPYGEAYIREIFMESEISTHYLIQRDGTVYCYVPENRAAWHAGVGELEDDPKYTNTMNQYAIGIELAAIGSAADMEKYMPAAEYKKLDETLIGFTDAQYESLALLVSDICTRNDIPMDETHIIGHETYSPDKTDPGELFDWNRVIPETAG